MADNDRRGFHPMKRNRGIALAAAGAVAALVLAACGGSSGSNNNNNNNSNAAFNAGTTGVVNASNHKGGTLTFDRGKLPLGPSYFTFMLAPQKPAYPGPYTDRAKNLMGLKAVTTPNATTIQFHLAQPFADFNYVVAIPQTAPVPPAKDTGAN